MEIIWIVSLICYQTIRKLETKSNIHVFSHYLNLSYIPDIERDLILLRT